MTADIETGDDAPGEQDRQHKAVEESAGGIQEIRGVENGEFGDDDKKEPRESSLAQHLGHRSKQIALAEKQRHDEERHDEAVEGNDGLLAREGDKVVAEREDSGPTEQDLIRVATKSSGCDPQKGKGDTDDQEEQAGDGHENESSDSESANQDEDGFPQAGAAVHRHGRVSEGAEGNHGAKVRSSSHGTGASCMPQHPELQTSSPGGSTARLPAPREPSGANRIAGIRRRHGQRGHVRGFRTRRLRQGRADKGESGARGKGLLNKESGFGDLEEFFEGNRRRLTRANRIDGEFQLATMPFVLRALDGLQFAVA